jgi:23S rRNA A2030 N6-methylase RlmJ
MFTAVIIACHIASAQACMTIIDNRGPYNTENECKERIGEMAQGLINLWTSERVPMVFKMTSCVHPDEIQDKTAV